MCPSNDGSESEVHFLLFSPFFDTQRSLLDRKLPSIRPLGIANPSDELLSLFLLYGCKELPADSNREILQGTISFIRETGRFNDIIAMRRKIFPKIVGPFSTILALLYICIFCFLRILVY